MKNKKIAIALIVLVGLTAGILSLNFLSFEVEGDSLKYEQIALNIAGGRGFAREGQAAVEAPGYPFFLSLVYLFFGPNYTAVKVIQLLLLISLALIYHLIAFKFLKLSPFSALIAGLLVVVWPYFLLYSNLLLTEILFSFLLGLNLLVLLYLTEKKRIKKIHFLLGGLLLGLAALTRAVLLFFPFWLFILFLLFLEKTRKKEFILGLLALLVIFCFTLTPWTVRNYLQFGRFIPVQPGLFNMFQRGYSKLDYTEGKEALGEGEVGFKEMALARVKNIFLFWNPGAGGERAETLAEKYPLVSYLLWAYRIFFLGLLGLAFYSVRFMKEKTILFVWIVIAYFWAVHIVLYPYPRYTLPIIPLVILLALYALNKLASKKQVTD